MNRLDAFFELSSRGTSFGRELRGAVATFLTMAYILGANPAILAGAGLPTEAVVAGTAAAAGICCLLMGLCANFPIALASGMGLNAVIVSFALNSSVGSWQAAMGLVVLDGVIVTLLVLAGVRESMLRAIPVDLRRAIGAGIGLFIALIGLVNAGLVTRGEFPVPPVEAGSLKDPATALAVAGLLLMATLVVKKVPGALLIGIIAITVAARVCDAIWQTEISGPLPTSFALLISPLPFRRT